MPAGGGPPALAGLSINPLALVVLACALGRTASATIPSVDAASACRLLFLLAAIGQEYDEAFDADGALVRPLELEEARLLLAEARDRGQRLGAEGSADFERRLGALADSIAARAPAAGVAAQVQAIREAVRSATGVSDDTLPAAPPSPARGEEVFRTQCASCHGDDGRGDGPQAHGLDPRPPDFTDPTFMRQESPADFFTVVSLGRRQAAMPGWEDTLSIQARWDAVGYLWSLGTTYEALVEGEATFAAHCAGCHGTRGDGPDLGELDRLAGRTDADLDAAIANGVPGDRMPAFAAVLGDEQRRNVIAYVRTLSLGLPAAIIADPRGLGWALARVARGVTAAVEAYRLREDRAPGLAADAYLLFEPLEPRIATNDPAAVWRVEAAFVRLNTALRRPGAASEVDAAAAAVRDGLEAAERVGRGRAVELPRPRAGVGGLSTGVVLSLAGIVLGVGVAALISLRLRRARADG